MQDCEVDTRFKPVLEDPVHNQTTARRVAILSGKLFYDLVNERKKRNLDPAVALIRIEDLSPFPFKELEDVLRPYTNNGVLEDLIFVQEEPKNQGAFAHVHGRINTVLKKLEGQHEVRYKGRKESALPAPGIGKMYQAQQKALIESVFADLS